MTKRGLCRGHRSKISWTQVEIGSAITWKYPSCVLKGDESVGEFYSVAVTNNYQQADTGTKMIHVGRNSRSTIVSKGISAGKSQNSYRGLVKVAKDAANCRNYTQCDSLLMGNQCGAHTFPYIDVQNSTSTVEHEATTSKINEAQALLLSSARHTDGRGCGIDCQRLCKGGYEQTSDGVCGGGAETASDHARRERGMIPNDIVFLIFR